MTVGKGLVVRQDLQSSLKPRPSSSDEKLDESLGSRLLSEASDQSRAM